MVSLNAGHQSHSDAERYSRRAKTSAASVYMPENLQVSFNIFKRKETAFFINFLQKLT